MQFTCTMSCLHHVNSIFRHWSRHTRDTTHTKKSNNNKNTEFSAIIAINKNEWTSFPRCYQWQIQTIREDSGNNNFCFFFVSELLF